MTHMAKVTFRIKLTLKHLGQSCPEEQYGVTGKSGLPWEELGN